MILKPLSAQPCLKFNNFEIELGTKFIGFKSQCFKRCSELMKRNVPFFINSGFY